jgi:hypothetical protein
MDAAQRTILLDGTVAPEAFSTSALSLSAPSQIISILLRVLLATLAAITLPADSTALGLPHRLADPAFWLAVFGFEDSHAHYLHPP